MVIVIPFLSVVSVHHSGAEYDANLALCWQAAFGLERAAKAISVYEE
jgi:hypothetical protein